MDFEKLLLWQFILATGSVSILNAFHCIAGKWGYTFCLWKSFHGIFTHMLIYITFLKEINSKPYICLKKPSNNPWKPQMYVPKSTLKCISIHFDFNRFSFSIVLSIYLPFVKTTKCFSFRNQLQQHTNQFNWIYTSNLIQKIPIEELKQHW